MLLFIQILAISVAAFALDCPPRDKVYPCSCGEDLGVTAINCEGFNSVAELEPAVKNTIGYNVSFGFFRSHLGVIPSDLFKGHTSKILRFEECVIFSFGDEPFSGLENSLENLYIYTGIDKSVTNMTGFKLSHLQKLKYISFAYNDFEEVTNEWFEGGPLPTKIITLVGNKIERLGDKAFASLANLEQLHIGDNGIKVFSRSMLPKSMRRFWIIEAKSNEIEELPSDAFEGLQNLLRINLSKNKLKSIPESVWGKVWNQLDFVNLEGNDVLCDENLKWIYAQKLPESFIGKCGPFNNLHDRDFNSLKLEDFQ